MFPPLAERLARAGFTAVSFNLSGSGVDDSGEFVFPERFGHATFTGDLGDIRLVVGRAGQWRARRRRSQLDRISRALPRWRPGRPRGRRGQPDRRAGHLGRHQQRAPLCPGRGRGLARAGPDGRAELAHRSGAPGVHRCAGRRGAPRRRRTLDIPAAAGRITAPWLIVHGEADPTVPLARGDGAPRRCAGPPRTDGDSRRRAHLRHGASVAGSDSRIRRGLGRRARWFGRHLG